MTANATLAIMGLSLIVLGLSSKVVKEHALSPTVLAIAIGVLVGPHVLSMIDVTTHAPRHVVLEQISRITLAIAVVDITLRLRPSDLRANAARLAVLLGVVMPGMWLVTAWGAVVALGMSLPVALVLAACLTPTDPGVASALVTGMMPNRSLPRRVRMTLQAEAAANDGLALPFVLFSGALVAHSLGGAITTSGSKVGRELGIAILVGVAVGWTLMKLVDAVGVHRLAEEDWFPLASAGLATSVLALAHLAGGTGVFAAFVAGLVFSEGVPEKLREPMHEVHRSLTKVALTVTFVAFGTVLPIDEWGTIVGVAGVAFAVWVVLLRRFPVAFVALRASGTGSISSSFLAWSGPLGAAAIYYLAYSQRFRIPDAERFFAVGSAAIVASVVVQAGVAAAAVHAYRKRTGREEREGEHLEIEGPLP